MRLTISFLFALQVARENQDLGWGGRFFLPSAAGPAPSVARSGSSYVAEQCCGPMGDGMARPGSSQGRPGRTEARFHGFRFGGVWWRRQGCAQTKAAARPRLGGVSWQAVAPAEARTDLEDGCTDQSRGAEGNRREEKGGLLGLSF